MVSQKAALCSFAALEGRMTSNNQSSVMIKLK